MRNWIYACLFAVGCASGGGSKPATPAAATTAAQKSLYERLGQKPAITAVVEEMLSRIANDQKINARFANADLPHLKLMLVDQICQATGGPCKYAGKDMKTAHLGQKITDDEFGALVGDLKGALDKFKVPAAEQNELISALGGLKGDIVGQ